ncbi:MAG: TIGR04283 family arsenosugar biosynthesis glycosyltransferase [Candidatus Sumerlaeota bacterium]|nr:TIGR04283 family arsenosugar biosynthesis glycosyltransferase [Candidatus Sumerlaeota bacterium]
MISAPRLSIIIPVRNEQHTITSLLRSLARQDMLSETQVVVVDGRSEDATRDVISGFPFVRLVSSEPGRARQMNAGAGHALAPVLWFLHSDSTLSERNCINAILGALADPAVAGGAFRFRLRGDDAYYRFVTALVNLRSRLFHRHYGDQGIFTKADVFREIGGFLEDEPCEDLDFVLRLRQRGRFVLLDQAVETSARTWQKYGKWRTTMWHIGEWLRFEWRRLTSPRSAEPSQLPEPEMPSETARGGAAPEPVELRETGAGIAAPTLPSASSAPPPPPAAPAPMP